jgi:hypothetical protein
LGTPLSLRGLSEGDQAAASASSFVFFCFLPRMGHLHAQLVHAANQCFGGTAAVFESVFANQEETCTSVRAAIAQEDPVNGRVNVGFDTGVSAKT